MDDISRYLPLSGRRGDDGDPAPRRRGPQIADVLDSVRALLAGAPPTAWRTPSLAEGWAVRDTVGHLLWRIGTPTVPLLVSAAREWAAHPLAPHRVTTRLARVRGDADPDALLASLESLAADARSGRGRQGLGELTEAVIHGLDIAVPLGADLGLPPTVSGAVAVRRALTLPAGLRGVVRGRTLVADDAGWRLGRGPELHGSAVAILVLLFGRRREPITGDAL